MDKWMISSKPYNFAQMPPIINALLVCVSDSLLILYASPLLESLASFLCCLQLWHPTWHHAPTPWAKRSAMALWSLLPGRILCADVELERESVSAVTTPKNTVSLNSLRRKEMLLGSPCHQTAWPTWSTQEPHPCLLPLSPGTSPITPGPALAPVPLLWPAESCRPPLPPFSFHCTEKFKALRQLIWELPEIDPLHNNYTEKNPLPFPTFNPTLILVIRN